MFELRAQLVWAWFKGISYSFVVKSEVDIDELEIKSGEEIKIKFFDRENTSGDFKDILVNRNLKITIPPKYSIVFDNNNKKLKQFNAVKVKCGF